MTQDSQQPLIRRRLLIRLSSLGDIIMATAALGVLPKDETIRFQNEWLTAKEYAPLLQGHPQLHAVLTFDRKATLSEWARFCRGLWGEGYDEIIDLHGSLRTKIARGLFFFWGILEPSKAPRWSCVSKERVRNYGYFFFKRLWPKSWRPHRITERAARAAGGTGDERPDLKHLAIGRENPIPEKQRPYLCVMPSSLWKGKKWPVESFLKVLKQTKLTPVIFGTKIDPESFELQKALEASGHSFVSGVDRWLLPEVATVLAGAKAYLGSDTGLAHLAEAVGTPAIFLLGPNVPDNGFGPWRSDSRVMQEPLWCRPCGLDGRYCFRPVNRYLCLKRVKPEPVIAAVHAYEDRSR